MTYQPDTSDKLYYSIGEVARMFDVNASLIRFWEKEFEIIKPQKNKKGNRLFTKADLDKLHLIYQLVKEQGHTLDGAKRILRHKQDERVRKAETIQTLEKIKAALLEVDRQLGG
jgi:DNA-binding transcriptional MerR regulator